MTEWVWSGRGGAIIMKEELFLTMCSLAFQVIGVNVSNCSRRRSVVSVHSSCHLHATLDPDDHRYNIL